MTDTYDIVVIGAGSGGLSAAEFAAKLGANVALVEKDRLGGDCTWTGCVPSKALLKVAKVAHHTRTAGEYGLEVQPPLTNMSKVRNYVHRAIADIYQHETPDALTQKGIDVVLNAARFLDTHTLQAGDRILSAKKFIIATGAHPFIPPIPGLQDVPYLTYLQIFDNDRLPARLIVVGAGPVGAELAQAYQRLGSQVSLIDVGLLPKEEPEVATVMGQIFAREGIQFIEGLVTAVRQEGNEIVASIEAQEVRGDMLLVAVGRAPNVGELDLDKAGVAYSDQGIPVDAYLRTNVKHIYAAGDCVAGNYQFTHVAGWQAIQAARNALLPGRSNGVDQAVPWTTFTDPEVAHVGLTEVEAREKFGEIISVTHKRMNRIDRAVVENDADGFLKIVHKKNGHIVGATVVAARAGEVIAEFGLALEQKLKLSDLATTIHPYPTYAVGTQQAAGDTMVDNLLSGFSGKVLRGWIKVMG